ncbi:MAG: class B sortase [Clostridia bacterium]|nr:class B sortase [Clostridia bacterium]
MSRFGNKLLSLIAGLLMILMLAYAGYSLWDNAMVTSGAFIGSDLLKYKPKEISEDGTNPTLEELKLINDDVRGWLTIDATNVDYPVVQAEQDMYYVNRDVYKNFALSGAIFLTCINQPDFSDIYNVIYGHHMDNGAMFGNIVDFREADYFNKRKHGVLYLFDKTYDIDLFAAIETDAYDKEVYRTRAEDEDNSQLIEYLKENADQYRDIGIKGDEKVIAFSTCTTASTNGRVILFGRMKICEGGADDSHEDR